MFVFHLPDRKHSKLSTIQKFHEINLIAHSQLLFFFLLIDWNRLENIDAHCSKKYLWNFLYVCMYLYTGLGGKYIL